MAKRSPILGYNHNVRYRGLIWHVQTEDSGLQNPHLFTHLFHEGVIVSTRKLVYDAGSDEGAIKSLMQAQHKAVMKDLKKGYFDDKIDLYFVDTVGLLPRGAVEDAGAVERPSEVALPADAPELPVAPTLHDLEPPTIRQDPPDVPPQAPRTITADRTSGPSQVRNLLPDAELPSADNMEDMEMVAAVAVATTTMRLLEGMESEEIEIRVSHEHESEPESLDASRTSSGRRRSQHDTEMSVSDIPTMSDVPGMVIDDATRPNVIGDGSLGFSTGRAQTESAPALPPPRPTGDRPAVGAASLPPARPIARPPSRPAMTPPQVVSRPLSEDGGRRDAVEIYAPAPPSADMPPGMSERPGQYAQHRRGTGAIPADIVRDRGSERSGPIPLVNKLPPRRSPTGAPPLSRVASPSREAIPPTVQSAPSSGSTMGSGPVPSRTKTPARIPAPNRTGGGGVVMTRPAVIVGAPAKPAATTRVRKAREDEGRGFGQGLISEKSLDEVILAYLSEDAEEK